jgi:hypothetical protein
MPSTPLSFKLLLNNNENNIENTNIGLYLESG